MTTGHAATAAYGFARSFGRAPEGVWSAPGRVNLIGEHTDYQGGLVLPIALAQRTCAALARRDDDLVRLVSRQHPDEPVTLALEELGPGSPAGWAGYAAGVVWALRRDGHDVGGLDLLVDGRVPPGAGLSSSAALSCSVALGVRDLFGLDISRAALVEAARAAENEVVGAPTGGMDQSASLLCRAGHALLLDCRDDSTRQLPLDLAGAGLSLLLLDTGAPHRLVDGSYRDRRAESAAAAAALGVPSLRDIEQGAALDSLLAREPLLGRRARHVATENARVLAVVDVLRSGGDPRAIGPVLTAGHASLRDDHEVSTPALDVVVCAAVAAGAHGARLVGGGFGGCAMALVDTQRIGVVVDAVVAAAGAAGHRGPTPLRAEPSGGARRVR